MCTCIRNSWTKEIKGTRRRKWSISSWTWRNWYTTFHPMASMYRQLLSLQLSTNRSAFLSASSKPSNGSLVAGNFVRSVDFSFSNKFPISLTCSDSCSQFVRCVVAFWADDIMMIMLARFNASSAPAADACGKLAIWYMLLSRVCPAGIDWSYIHIKFQTGVDIVVIV